MKRICTILTLLLILVCGSSAFASPLRIGEVAEEVCLLPALSGKGGLVILFGEDAATEQLLGEAIAESERNLGLFCSRGSDADASLRVAFGLPEEGAALVLLDGGRRFCALHEGPLADEEALNAFLSALPVYTPDADGMAHYILHIVNEKGEAVPKVYVQFCDENSCSMAKSDENGLVEFVAEPKPYDIHIIKVPKNFQLPEEALPMPLDGGELTPVLQEIG